MKALILEDEPGLLEDFSDCVKELAPSSLPSQEKTSFHVDGVKSAAAAKELLRKAQTQPYDVMLLDLSVPESRGNPNIEQGLDVLKQAQEEGGTREIVIVSGNGEGMDRARDMGAKHFVDKRGFRRDYLATAVTQALVPHFWGRIVAAIESTKILENRIRELACQSEYSLVYHFGLCFSRSLQEIDRTGDAIEAELYDPGDALTQQVAGLRDALKGGRRNWAALQTSLGLGDSALPKPICIHMVLNGLKHRFAACLFMKNARLDIDGVSKTDVLSFNGDVTAILSEMILGGLADVPDNHDHVANLTVSSQVHGDWAEVVLHDNLVRLSRDDVRKINEGIGVHTGPRFGRAWGLMTMQHSALRGGGRLIVEMPGEGNTIKYRIPRAHNA